MTVVSVVKEADPEKAVKIAVEKLGGMGSFIKNARTVMIKPNVITAASPPVTTNPEIVKTLVELCREAGVERVLVGESVAFAVYVARGLTTREAFKVTGMGTAVKAAGAEVVYFDEDERVPVSNSRNKVLKATTLPKSLVESDVLINAPVLKTHNFVDVSIGIKNFHGLVGEDMIFYHDTRLNQKLVDILNFIKDKLKLTVVDATLAMEGLGPFAGKPVKMDLVIAGADVVAVDAVSASIMGYDPTEIEMIKIANWEKLGTADLNKIDVKGEKIEDVKRIFKRPENTLSGYKNVGVFIGGACRMCLACIKTVLEIWSRKGMPKEKINLFVGCNPPLHVDTSVKSFIVGDCAVLGSKELRTKLKVAGARLGKPLFKIIDGCPPGSPTIAKALEEFGVILL